MGHQRRNGDDGAANGADNAAAEQAHKKRTFEGEIGETIVGADEAKGDADDERGGHEEHQF